MGTSIGAERDTRSLTDFKRHTSEVTQHIKQSGRPVVLTVNGKAEFVIQAAAAYQSTVEEVERAIAIAGIQRGLEEIERGEGQLASEFFKEFEAKHGLAADTEK